MKWIKIDSERKMEAVEGKETLDEMKKDLLNF